MTRIELPEKLIDLGRRVLKNDLEYKVYGDEHDYVIEIYRDNKKIYEFVCVKYKAQLFIDNAMEF